MSLLSLRGLEKRYGENVIFSNVNTEIEQGAVVSIIGPSGAGKSTLLRAINYLDPPTSGEVYFDGVPVTLKNRVAIRRRMGMVFQNFALFSHLSALENVAAGPIKLLKQPRAEAHRRATELLEQVGLGDRLSYFPYQLSGGQKQRVAIARCLAMNPEAILFDEPTSALDPAMTNEVMSVIRGLTKSSLTMVIVTQEMDFARQLSTRVLYMDEGGIHEEGTPEDIFSNPSKEKTRAFIHKITSYNFTADSQRFDFVQMLSGVEHFCFRNGFDESLAKRIQLVTEELMINLVVPRFGAATLNLRVAQDTGDTELTVTYPGPPTNAIETATDDLSALLVTNATESIDHFYSNGTNTLLLTL